MSASATKKPMCFSHEFDYSVKNLIPYYAVFEDVEGIVTAQQVIKNQNSYFNDTTANPKLDFGFTKSKVWCNNKYKFYIVQKESKKI